MEGSILEAEAKVKRVFGMENDVENDEFPSTHDQLTGVAEA
jgi:hypothetical protein